MSELAQIRMVAERELRERGRSRAFKASLLVMILIVAAAIVVPSMIGGGATRWDIGVVGTTPAGFADIVETQATTVDATARVIEQPSVIAGEDAVRSGALDVLVVDGRRLEWQRLRDEQLRAVVTTALQLLAVQQRATDAGISPEQLTVITEPVAIESVELGRVAGRSTDDEAAALIMNVILMMVIATFGSLVLTGVVEEKSSRVVEVLLARIRPRTLLAGKVLGIGLLGLAEVVLVVVAALIAKSAVDSVDLPATRASVLIWAIVWFVLGYALYSVAYGMLGSLASRSEDAQSASGAVTAVLVAGFWTSFMAVGSPESAWAKVVSFLPPTAPFSMPTRVAMGATAWWEPVLAAALTALTIPLLIELGGRIYDRAILHTGSSLTLRQAWRVNTPPSPTSRAGDYVGRTPPGRTVHR
jgi:ABC-2 type transport system permease protein